MNGSSNKVRKGHGDAIDSFVDAGTFEGYEIFEIASSQKDSESEYEIFIVATPDTVRSFPDVFFSFGLPPLRL